MFNVPEINNGAAISLVAILEDPEDERAEENNGANQCGCANFTSCNKRRPKTNVPKMVLLPRFCLKFSVTRKCLMKATPQ